MLLKTKYLNQIKLFLKQTNFKQFRYRPNIVDPRSEKIMGKLEVVSDGEQIWWEQTTNKRKRVLPFTKTYNKRLKDFEDYSKLYSLPVVEDVLGEFFTYFAQNFIYETNKLNKKL